MQPEAHACRLEYEWMQTVTHSCSQRHVCIQTATCTQAACIAFMEPRISVWGGEQHMLAATNSVEWSRDPLVVVVFIHLCISLHSLAWNILHINGVLRWEVTIHMCSQLHFVKVLPLQVLLLPLLHYSFVYLRSFFYFSRIFFNVYERFFFIKKKRDPRLYLVKF